MLDFTTIVAVDEQHAAEWRLTWPTWRALRKELLDRPMIVFGDGQFSADQWRRRLEFVDHPRWRLVTWEMDGVEQREKMLSALVLGAAREVATPWYLKLDTDTVAIAPGRWLDPQWFAADDQGRPPVFVTSPWGYTKPADALARLDDWGDGVQWLRGHPRLEVPWRPDAVRTYHPRIISWCFFGLTAWTWQVADVCGDRLPVPSQDTLLWYCAARRGEFFRRVRMSRAGWRHLHGRALAAAARKALASEETSVSSYKDIRTWR